MLPRPYNVLTLQNHVFPCKFYWILIIEFNYLTSDMYDQLLQSIRLKAMAEAVVITKLQYVQIWWYSNKCNNYQNAFEGYGNLPFEWLINGIRGKK